MRAVSSNKDVYSSVLSGEYRFGIGYIRSHMHAACTHACTLNTCSMLLHETLLPQFSCHLKRLSLTPGGSCLERPRLLW